MSFKIPSSKGMVIDGVAASECIDSSGEVIEIEGVDCAQLEEDGGILLNWEHKDGDEGADTIVGRVIYLKKIFKESDCETERQRDYWVRVRKNPFIYVVCRLFDGSGHQKARAIAAIIRDNAAHDEPLACRFSIEGTTTKKDGNTIKASLFKRLAVTVKPCNKTAVTGLLQDNAVLDEVTKAEPRFVDPEFAPLGGAVEVACNPCVDPKEEAAMRLLAAAAAIRTVKKALTAGSTDAAPSTLTGGAALQREDATKTVANTARAALRDYGWDRPFSRSEFRAFAKSKLPEASDEFIDHFTDLAETLSIKKALIKREAAAPKARAPKTAKAKAPAVVVPPEHQATNHAVLKELPDHLDHAPDETIEGEGGKMRNLAAGTFRGKKLKPNPGMVRPEFDAKKGVLHTPVGSFKAYLPGHDGPEADANYQRILSHPDIERAMDTAMGHWTKVHKLAKAGKLPPEVVMHAVLFAQLSPNKPVPTQELQFARLVDAMKQSGLDPRKPGFQQILPHIEALDKPDVLPETGRDAFRTNPAYYAGGRIGAEYDAAGNRVGKPSPATGRIAGDLLSARPLLHDNLKNMAKYHTLHDGLVELMGRHRHDMVGAVKELMDSKTAATNWANVRRAKLKAGKPDPGEYKGASIPGLKVKTGLYTWGMLGGGNSAVPDTHFIRNMFGLDLVKDKDTLEYLKNLMWRPTNMHVMEGFNNWYRDKHPAVQYTLNHPKWGSTFERPDDALFPAFWRHWLTIQPHERFLGMPNRSEQAGTDHAPFWEAIAPHVDPLLKTEGLDSSVALRTALVHQQYVKDYGEVPAMLLYFHHLVPKLLEAARHRERFGRDMGFLAKARQLEAGLVELRKSIDEVLNGPPVPRLDVHQVHLAIGGRQHPAGRFVIHNNRIHHLEDYHGLLEAMLPEGELDAQAVSRLHGLKWSPNASVLPHHSPDLAALAAPAPAPAAVTVTPQAPPPARPPVFEYHRPGMLQPHVVEFGPHGAAIDGKRLTDAELALIHDNVTNGIGTLRYKKLAQAPAGSADLSKAEGDEMDMEDVLQHMRQAHAEGRLHADPAVSQRMLDVATKHTMEDPMTQMGNKYAFTQFRAKNKPGVYISGDLTDFKAVNDTHGHDAGDEAIKAMGQAFRNAASRVGTIKSWRPGGDETAFYAPTYEDALTFVRHARSELDKLPPVNGVHKISGTFGIGHNFETADKALYEAKKGKIDKQTGMRAFPVGKVPHLAHSLYPGQEGPVSLHHEGVPAQHLPLKQEAKEGTQQPS